MSFLSNLFSSGASALVGAVGNVIDNLSTSDEEKLTLKNELTKEMNRFKESQMEATANYDKEITKRLELDMKSDSWLSKNIRPMMLIFVTAIVSIMAFTTIFILPLDKVELVKPWITLFTAVMMVQYAFYYGSRGIEKYQKMKKG